MKNIPHYMLALAILALSQGGAIGLFASDCANYNVEPQTRGAYFRKIKSDGIAVIHGITAAGTLPAVNFDSKRYYKPRPAEKKWMAGPMDRPSVYLGAQAGHKELDSGLTWDRVYDDKGLATFTDMPVTDGRNPVHRFSIDESGSQPVIYDGTGKIFAKGWPQIHLIAKQLKLRHNFAFRPFWRTSNRNESEHWHNPKPGSPTNIYFYPGEKIVMTLHNNASNAFELAIRVDGNNTPYFNISFKQEGFIPDGKPRGHTFKRVNSIDQMRLLNGRLDGNEGHNAIRTNAQALDGGWDSVYVWADENGQRLPLTGQNCVNIRGGDTAPDYDSIFRISGVNAQGGEIIDIIPPKP